jgi:hypothetical protein
MIKQFTFALLVGTLSFNAVAKNDSQIYDYFSNLNSNSDLNKAKDSGWSEADNDLSILQKGKSLEAKTVGRQAGQFYAEGIVRNILEEASPQLDKIFDISMYIDAYKNTLIIPAIIMETKGRKQYINEKHSSFIYAEKTYVIQKQPYFADHLPKWQDYVVLKAKAPKVSSSKLLPSTPEEKAAWKKSFDEGWKLGINAAVESVKYQLARALYDIQGMQLYGMLRDAQIVSEPIITENKTPVSGNDERLELNGGIISIKTMPLMQHNAKQWKMIPSLPPLNELLPARFFALIDNLYEN